MPCYAGMISQLLSAAGSWPFEVKPLGEWCQDELWPQHAQCETVLLTAVVGAGATAAAAAVQDMVLNRVTLLETLSLSFNRLMVVTGPGVLAASGYLLYCCWKGSRRYGLSCQDMTQLLLLSRERANTGD